MQKEKTEKMEKETNSTSFGSAVMISLYVLLFKIFSLPIIVVKKAIKGIKEDENRETDIPVLVYNKQILEALIILSWPVIACILMYNAANETYWFENIIETGKIIFILIGAYLFPISIALVKEIITITLTIVLKLEDIYKNTKK